MLHSNRKAAQHATIPALNQNGFPSFQRPDESDLRKGKIHRFPQPAPEGQPFAVYGQGILPAPDSQQRTDQHQRQKPQAHQNAGQIKPEQNARQFRKGLEFPAGRQKSHGTDHGQENRQRGQQNPDNPVSLGFPQDIALGDMDGNLPGPSGEQAAFSHCVPSVLRKTWTRKEIRTVSRSRAARRSAPDFGVFQA